MAFRCPGQLRRDVTAETRRCPRCGGEVEIFSDELSAVCRRCGGRVYQEGIPSCVEWCRAARECIGAERYEQVMRELREAAGRREVRGEAASRRKKEE